MIQLLLPFDTDDPAFARGFEAGALWAALRAREDPVEAIVHATNSEMVLRMADASERRVTGEQLDERWTAVVFEAAGSRNA